MTILCYHAVDPAWGSPLAVTPQAFGRHAAWLARHRRVVDLEAADRAMGPGGRLPRGLAAITFDDGFAGVLEHAVPELVRWGLPATVFVVAGTLEGAAAPRGWVREPVPDGVRTLSRDEILALRDADMRIGSHSYSHHDLTELSDEECERDLRRSREVLEDLVEGPVRRLAYPRGLHDERVRRLAARAGFSRAYTLPERREQAGPLAVPRVGIYRGNDGFPFRMKLAPWYLRVRLSRVYGVVRRPPGAGRAA